MSSEVVRFTGDHFPEVVTAKTVEAAISPEVALLRPPLALLGDIRVSQYGAVCFTLLDSKPENRITNWNYGSEYFGYEGDDEPGEYEYTSPTPDDVLKIPRIYGTRHGFKLIRYAIIPQEVVDVLDTNKWVGPAVLDQALEDGVTPAEYLEQNLGPAYAILMSCKGEPIVFSKDAETKGKYEEFQRPFKAKVAYYKTLLRSLDGSIEEDAFEDLGPSVYNVSSRFPSTHRAYVSFHPWHLIGSVAAEAPHMVARMTANLDDLIANFVDKDGSLRASLEDQLEQNPAYLPIGRVALEADPTE